MNSPSYVNDERKVSPESMIVLVKCEKNNPKIHDIYVNKNNFKIGRNRDCDDHILDTCISRNHCILNYENEQWTITNLSSVGTKVNGILLQNNCPQTIDVGDIIQLNEECDEFKFCVKYFLDDQPQKKRAKIEETIFHDEIAKQKLFAEEQEAKRKELEQQLKLQQNEQEKLKAHLEEVLKNQQATEGKNEEQNELIRCLEKKIESGNEIESKLKENYEHLLNTVELQKQKFETLLNEERQKWQQTLDMTKQEKTLLEKKMLEDMAVWRQNQHAEWTSVVNDIVKREKEIQYQLSNEKAILEQKLRDTQTALEEKTALAEQLQTSVQNQQMVILEITANNVNQEPLVTIDLTKEDGLNVASSSRNDNCEPDAVVTQVGNLMDQTLTCQICSELFVNAVTLNCSHSFCQYCIHLWIRKKCECPICRAKIMSINRSLVLDNFIEQMVNDFTPQNKEKRKELVNEHQAAIRTVGLSNQSNIINYQRKKVIRGRR
ncbi:E3 ubiquitin-protein ligase rnf8-like [Chelonus insularis]|uniref:E3 ubiquitin-protein ligase rnf8-like n=1 Tax=Chelonus insularis TaxID=460826 RepID=UPI00158D986F|nr:E3 ubiquitin-protein ligase rnf8-like [Chelonus insularis]XP_034940752.1 E3 ubiquitin-protein ligase rnf8-like [Chelonus insularis]